MNRRVFVTIGSFAAVVPTAARAQQAAPPSSMSQFAVAIPHHLPRPEALRRLKSGLASLQREYGYLFAIQDEKWSGYHLAFRASVMGQPADGTIDVTTSSVYLAVVLPWLFAVMARAAEPLIVREGTAMLERK
jgi:Putative polyhydroxyalkanoic acid system protein (PHA_gran_rgn)